MNFKNIFVTVGTTEFNQLIESFTKPEINDILNNLGCKYLTLQIGKGKEFLFDNLKGIKVEVFSLKTTINEEIKAADLVRKFYSYCLFILVKVAIFFNNQRLRQATITHTHSF